MVISASLPWPLDCPPPVHPEVAAARRAVALIEQARDALREAGADMPVLRRISVALHSAKDAKRKAERRHALASTGGR